MDLSRAPRRTARKKGSGYENEDEGRDHSRPQSHFHSVTRWKLGSGLHDQMERSDWLLREPANYHAH
jgi:hypothetical protein